MPATRDWFARKSGPLIWLAVAMVILILAGRAMIIDLCVVPRWREIDALIVHARVQTSSSVNDHSEFADVDYRYVVDGMEFSGHCCNSTSWFDDEHAFVKENATGTSVPIYVDPRRPSESQLKSRLKASAVGEGSIVVLALLFVVAGIRMFRSPRPAKRGEG
ncbi:MAG TPA: DUF3592 domain-containing protein [Polyangia bacterium]|nr:DUF3592 domain-containing protein [Polyangia bacterium]